MATIVKRIVPALLLALLTACAKSTGGQDPMTWAREALDRNDRVQVVAADTAAKTFTVRIKETGELRVVPLEQIVAGPPMIAGVDASQRPAAAVARQAPAEASAPAAPAPAPEPAHPPGSDSAEEAAASTEAQVPHAQSAINAKAGSVLASGPGYSIEASGSRGSPVRSSTSAARGTPERLHDPIICQGARLLHIDNRNLEFDGDAVSAEDGCEIHITNTRISARGVGVLARGANVHIKNSEIEGGSGSIDASQGAQVYAESSRFKGVTRRMEASAFHDLGGNVWN